MAVNAVAETAGVGLLLLEEAGRLVVSGIIPNGPATKADVCKGDVLVQVDGHAIGSTVASVRPFLVGPPGTAVNLSLLRGDSLVTLQIVRALLPSRDTSSAASNLALSGGGGSSNGTSSNNNNRIVPAQRFISPARPATGRARSQSPLVSSAATTNRASPLRNVRSRDISPASSLRGNVNGNVSRRPNQPHVAISIGTTSNHPANPNASTLTSTSSHSSPPSSPSSRGSAEGPSLTLSQRKQVQNRAVSGSSQSARDALGRQRGGNGVQSGGVSYPQQTGNDRQFRENGMIALHYAHRRISELEAEVARLRREKQDLLSRIDQERKQVKDFMQRANELEMHVKDIEENLVNASIDRGGLMDRSREETSRVREMETRILDLVQELATERQQHAANVEYLSDRIKLLERERASALVSPEKENGVGYHC